MAGNHRQLLRKFINECDAELQNHRQNVEKSNHFNSIKQIMRAIDEIEELRGELFKLLESFEDI